MGSACCVAAREKNIGNRLGNETLHRNIRYSPTWSFRWDNRRRVAGEETSVSWPSDGSHGTIRNESVDTKSAYASEEGSPLENLRRQKWHKSPMSEETTVLSRTSGSDKSLSRNVSTDVSLEQVKEPGGSPTLSYSSPMKLSVSLPSTSSLSTSPLMSQTKSLQCPAKLPAEQQVSSNQILLKSSNNLSITKEIPWSNESVDDSHVDSSDDWSMHAFSELMATSHRERWSFDKMSRSSSRISSSPSVDIQTCRICSKLLTEKSSWSSSRDIFISTNDLSVIAVLICGHAYHAECLENMMTPDIDKYDPACPVCILGEKQTHKLSQKALQLKAKQSKKLRKRITDSDFHSGPVSLDRIKSTGHEGKGLDMSSSSTIKPSLRRHFSFGSKGSKSALEESSQIKKKGFFWAKSSKV